MLILTSPAKTMDFEDSIPVEGELDEGSFSRPEFQLEADELALSLQKQTPPQLQKILKVSEKLAELNHERYQDWADPTTPKRATIFAYRGDVFQQLGLESYGRKEINYLQNNLKILTGLYGVLRPLDIIQAYRLEMGTKLPEIGSLYDFWREKLTEQLKSEIKNNKHKFVLNLASKEYSAALDLDGLGVPVYTVDFKQRGKDGKIKTYGLLAKRARGQMIDYLAQESASDLEKVVKFDRAGYEYLGLNNSQLLYRVER